MEIDVNELEEFMEVVNAKADPNKDTFDQEFAALAESSKQAITQYNAEINILGTITPKEWVSNPYRQSQGWPQRLWQLKEAWEKQSAQQAEQQEAQAGTDSALKEALEELKALKAEIAELREAQKPGPEPTPTTNTTNDAVPVQTSTAQSQETEEEETEEGA